MSRTNRFLFTSESVTEGHPDKIADQISDAILDACLTEDPSSRVACETLLTTGLAFIAGEITTKAYVDFPSIVRGTVKAVGYTDAWHLFPVVLAAVAYSLALALSYPYLARTAPGGWPVAEAAPEDAYHAAKPAEAG